MSDTTTEQHPIGLYLKVWLLLFVLSAFSYMVDYFQLQGYLRWTLILLFMVLKAGVIIAIFMHFAWERFALKLLILLPPGAVLLLILMMMLEADYIYALRMLFYTQPNGVEPPG